MKTFPFECGSVKSLEMRKENKRSLKWGCVETVKPSSHSHDEAQLALQNLCTQRAASNAKDTGGNGSGIIGSIWISSALISHCEAVGHIVSSAASQDHSRTFISDSFSFHTSVLISFLEGRNKAQKLQQLSSVNKWKVDKPVKGFTDESVN